MDNNPSSSSPPSSPLLLPAPNPPQPSPSSSPSPTASASASASNPSSPDDVKPKLELVPYSTPETDLNPSPKPNSNSNTKSPPKRTPPLPWTHQETISLIQTYQEKWYSLKKGQLKANQWEDVSLTVATRCGYDVPSKTATQCRHKIEKLRKRYRAELLKPYPNAWQYFELMDRMERGPMPITARPVSAVKYQNQKNASAAGGTGNHKESESDEGDGNSGVLEVKKNKSKSINNIVRGVDFDVGNNSNRNVNKTGMSRAFDVGENNVRISRGLRTPVIQKRKGYFQEDESIEDDEDDDDDEGEELEQDEEVEVEEKGRGDVGKELAAEIRGFAERFMRMENKKIEMMRETETYRMEMEKKRMDKILEAQRKVLDTIGRAFGAHKKVKMAQ